MESTDIRTNLRKESRLACRRGGQATSYQIAHVTSSIAGDERDSQMPGAFPAYDPGSTIEF
jgi:hypothetical protein